MLKTNDGAGPGGANRITTRWLAHALQHQITYNIVQAPPHPFQIKASAAPPAGVSIAALSLATQITGVTGA